MAMDLSKPAPKSDLMALFNSNKMQEMVKKNIPKHLDPERSIQLVTTAITRNPDLAECTPYSLISCLIQSTQLGLEMFDPRGLAYAIPFKNKKTGMKEATFVVGYKGLIDLVWRNNRVSAFYSHNVYEKDFFFEQLGTDQRLEHKKAEGDRGKIIGSYAVVRYVNGGVDHEYLTVEEMDTVRKNFGVWKDDPEAMYRKTPIRRLSKRIPQSVDIARAVDWEEKLERGERIDLDIDMKLPEQEREISPIEQMQPEGV